MPDQTRLHYQEELECARDQGARRARPGRPVPGSRHGGGRAPGRRAGRAGRRRRRPDRRPLPRGSPGDPHPARHPGSRRHRPAPDLGAAPRHEVHGADGRPVREHREADPADRPRRAAALGDARPHPARWASRSARRSPSASRAFEGRDVELARDLVRQDDLVDDAQQGVLPDRGGGRRGQGHARVGDDDDARRPRPRAHRRQRGRHRRAGRVRRHRASSASSRTRRTPGRLRAPRHNRRR